MRIRNVTAPEWPEQPCLAFVQQDLLPMLPPGILPSGSTIELFSVLNSSEITFDRDTAILVTDQVDDYAALCKELTHGRLDQLLVSFHDEPAELLGALTFQGDALAVDGLDMMESSFVVKLVRADSTDRPFHDFAYGFSLGALNQLPTTASAEKNVAVRDDVEKKYLELLLFLQELAEGTTTAVSSITASPAGKQSAASDADLAKLANLTQEVIRLQASNASLQRKYRSLSNSKLGKLTLKYWDYKRELKK